MYSLHGDVISEGQMFENMYVTVSNNRITSVEKKAPPNHSYVKKVEGGYICPGYIDIHIHGLNGLDFMDETNTFQPIAEQLPEQGVTSFLATSRTADMSNVLTFLNRATEFESKVGTWAKILGAHVEGPWISGQYKGAQPEAFIRKLTWQDIETFIEPYQSIISNITLAPETLSEYSMIEYLTNRGINISAGHTNATIEDIERATAYGLKQTTHTFNAMSPIHHRTPGVAAAVLYLDTLHCELIADGLHVHPRVIELLYKVKGYKNIMLVSDCTGYNHLADGTYFYRQKSLQKKGKSVTLPDGTLAGSAITINQAVQYIVEHCHVPIEEAIYMATEAPIRHLKTSEKVGKVKAGYQADLAILNDDLSVKETVINGEIVHTT